jgi:hypothetical protein
MAFFQKRKTVPKMRFFVWKTAFRQETVRFLGKFIKQTHIEMEKYMLCQSLTNFRLFFIVALFSKTQNRLKNSACIFDVGTTFQIFGWFFFGQK